MNYKIFFIATISIFLTNAFTQQVAQNIPQVIFSTMPKLFLNPRLTNTCKNKLLHIANNFTHDSALMTFLGNSGKGINDLGNYKACVEDRDSTYYTLDISGMPVVLAIGLCMPKECGPSDFDPLRATIAHLINSAFSSNETSPLSKNLTEKNVRFIDPRDYPNEYGFAFAALLIIIAIIFLLNIASVAVRYFAPNSITDKNEIKLDENAIFTTLHYFDPVKNYARLFGDLPEKYNPDLQIFSGIRFGMMLWVIVGHTYYYAQFYPLVNPTAILDFMKGFWHSYLTNATYSVDVFFFMSGFLAFYLIFFELRAKNGDVSYWKFIVHRIIRMSPLYFIICVVFAYVFPNIVEGPMKYTILEGNERTCQKTLYSNFFYFINWVPPKEECCGWLWYVSNDMQFFLLVPIFAFLFRKSKLIGAAVCGGVGLTCIIITYSLGFKYNLSASYMKFTDDYFEYYYDKPYARVAPYICGVLASMFYCTYKTEQEGWVVEFSNKIKESNVLRYLLYLVSAVSMFWLVHAMYWLNVYPDSWTKMQDISYLVLNKALFVIVLFFILYPAMLGKATFFSKIFGHPIFNSLGKVTYAAYMYHPMMMEFYTGNETKGEFFENEKYRQKFFGYVVMGYGLSYILTPLIESPLRALSRKYLHPYDYPYQNENNSVLEINEGTKINKSINRDEEETIGMITKK